MKIGFVLDDSLDSTDGVQQYVRSLGTWLSGQGHSVHYLVGNTKRNDLPNVHSLSRNITVRFNGNRLSVPLPASRRRIKRLLAGEQFDVLHVQMPYSPFMAARVITLAPASTRMVGTFHTMPLSRFAYWCTWVLALCTRSATQRIHTVLSVSEPAQQFAASLGIRSEVLPNVVDAARFAIGRPLKQYQSSCTVVFLGRLVHRKGCQQLLRAVYDWHQQHKRSDLRVLICGDGPQRSALQRFVTAHNLEDIVTFVGFVPEDQKTNYLATADIAVFPSLGGESFGIVLLEAMASGAGVVIGGNNPGYSSVLGTDSPTVFDPNDRQALSDLLEQLRADKKLRLSLHAQQKELVQQYDVAKVGRKLLRYYQGMNT